MTPGAVMIFAAGFGTRMGALTANRPKALIEVGGMSLLDRTLSLANEVGIARKVVNAHYRAEQIAAHLAGHSVTVSHEMPEILDTGGGLKAALPLFRESPVFTANSDAVFDGPNPFSVAAADWGPDMEALLLVVPITRAVGRKGGGDFDLSPEGVLSRGGAYVYTGIQIIRTERVAAESARVFSLNAIWNAMPREGLRGVVYPGRWCDVGHPDGIPLAEAVLEGRDV